MNTQTKHLNMFDPKYARAVAEMLRPHDGNQPASNITSAVRDFFALIYVNDNAE